MMSDEYIGLTFAYTVMVLTDLIGNTLVCLVVMRNRSMQTPMNYLLVNLAIADMMVAVFIAIQFIFGPLYVHPDGQTGIYLCKFITGGTMAWTGAVASVFSLVAISIERYFAVLYPYTTKGRVNNRNLKYIVIVCWVSAFVLNTPLYINVTYRTDLQRCGENWPNMTLPKIYSFGWNVVVGLVPISIMSFAYIRVINSLWIKKENASATQQGVMKSRKRVTKMAIAVSVIFVFCWTPVLVMYFRAYMLPHESMHSVIHQITIVLATFNSSINPIIYSLHSDKFRKHLCGLLCCGRCFAGNEIVPDSQENRNENNKTTTTTRKGVQLYSRTHLELSSVIEIS